MTDEKLTLGWREWVSLPSLAIDGVNAKVDTGAKTSALHAYYVEPLKIDGQQWVRFGIHPIQNNLETAVECRAPVVDLRRVTDSGGHTEERYVILIALKLGDIEFEAEVTLTNRDTMKFRMLLGRNAISHRFVVDPAQSFLMGRTPNSNRQENEVTDDENSNSIEE